jgi:hypothetical protein
MILFISLCGLEMHNRCQKYVTWDRSKLFRADDISRALKTIKLIFVRLCVWIYCDMHRIMKQCEIVHFALRSHWELFRMQIYSLHRLYVAPKNHLIKKSLPVNAYSPCLMHLRSYHMLLQVATCWLITFASINSNGLKLLFFRGHT